MAAPGAVRVRRRDPSHRDREVQEDRAARAFRAGARIGSAVRDLVPELLQPHRRGAVARRAPVAARRQRAARSDLGRVRDRRALELAGAEEAVEEDLEPVLDLGERVLVAALGRDQVGPDAELASRPTRGGRGRRPCSAGSRSAARSRGRSPAARRGRRRSRCPAPGCLRRGRRGGSARGRSRSRAPSCRTALAASPNWPVSIAQRIRNWISVFGTEALTL